MEEDFRFALISAPSVIGLVPAGRINMIDNPQGSGAPYIVLQVIGDAQGMTMQGPDGLSQGRMQVDCYGRTYAEVKAISRAVVAVLHGYRGRGLRLVEHAGTRDDREGGSNEAERLFRVSLDFITNWRA